MVDTDARFDNLAGAGYSDVHCNRIVCSLPAARQASTPARMSAPSAMPVERMTGFPFDAMCLIKSVSGRSNDATL